MKRMLGFMIIIYGSILRVLPIFKPARPRHRRRQQPTVGILQLTTHPAH